MMAFLSHYGYGVLFLLSFLASHCGRSALPGRRTAPHPFRRFFAAGICRQTDSLWTAGGAGDVTAMFIIDLLQ